MLEIRNLHASAAGQPILKGVDLSVRAGEVHAVMGPNGSGKSTLAHVLAGKPGYEVTAGTAIFEDRNLLDLEPDERARRGVFLAFQYPVDIPGVGNGYFLRTALNAQRRSREQEELDPFDFLELLRERADWVGFDRSLLHRAVNDGFSGGEKKRNEILQMAVLEPSLAILDETDSGLDIDALRDVARGINTLRSPDRAMILVTHYQRLLDHVRPDFVHVLIDGKIAKSGDEQLARELEQRGYGWLEAPGSPSSQHLEGATS